MRQRIAATLGIVAILMSTTARADCTDDAMIVFDGSGSMAEMGFNQIDEPRIFEARRAMRTVMPQVEPCRRIGLIVYAKALGAPEKPGTVVLVTDGKETCGGTTCALAAELSGTGLTVHVIGFKVRGEHFGWQSQGETDYVNSVSIVQCLATQTGGEYVSAETVDDLIAAMNRTLGCNLLF